MAFISEPTVPRNSEFLKLYLTHRGELVNYASRILGDRGHAEDVVQEAYLKFNAAAEERSVSEPLAYLYRIVRNLCHDLQRGLQRECTRQEAGESSLLHVVSEEKPSPESEASGKQELRILAEAMAELPERTRVALEMHRFGEATLKEIAAQLGISVGLAHSLVVQGLEHCRERLYRKR
ncbi:sigma-70 family RNA polymerase sigma factor [Fodinicurvata halophila]|uniref:sigma-70 family RNA polymerase sigma factor n=1 Tax=Fodinicurvata halophila TaxID=1419723 RepID=UPI00360E2226